ncbi:D-alanyl-D-alanine carboxypeptidase/D-alanyl-D-alanine-endopeptidase [bacterium]|nr:D-alanyl-D-alanine carboxypeptidase/D-alanyl-D-alanine-endopeptidase [bacterium]
MPTIRYSFRKPLGFSVSTIVCAAVISLCATGAKANGQEADFAAGIEKLLKTPGYENAHWGLLVADAETGKVIYEKNAGRLFGPASVTKLFTTAAALEKLGPDHRFRTVIKRRGEVDANGELKGDLILIASGDMAMGGRTAPDGRMLFEDNDHTYGGDSAALVTADPLHAFELLAHDLAAAGIKSVTGEVMVDDRLFRPSPSSGSGPRTVSAITINDNLVNVVIEAGKAAGEPATFRTVPATSTLNVDFRVTTVEKDGPTRVTLTTLGPRSVQVRGTIPYGRKNLIRSFEVVDPPAWARGLLIETLRKKGIRVEASPLGTPEPIELPSRSETAALPTVATYDSPPLGEFVKVILKVSHNLYASSLPLVLAASDGKRTLNDGLRIEGQMLEKLGVPANEVSFGGGAGGARADMVTPRATVKLLTNMGKHPGFAAYETALPVLGRDGTLSRAVGPDSPAKGHVRAKTGTYFVDNDLTGRTVLTSKALAGYLDTAHNRPLVFCMFLNDVPTRPASGDTPAVSASEAGKLLGRICEWIYSNCPRE